MNEAAGSLMERGDEAGPSSIALTPLERRKQERRCNDPHHASPFRRMYIGPSPVSARSASSVAAAIAQDVDIARPIAIGVVGGTGTIAAASFGRSSHDNVSLQAHFDDSASLLGRDKTHSAPPVALSAKQSKQSLQQNAFSEASASAGGPSTPSSSPVKRVQELSPLHVPRNQTTPGQRRFLQRDTSFASNKSREGNIRRLPASQTHEDEGSHGILRNRSSRRRLSQSYVEPRIGHEHDTVKFDEIEPHQRRQMSEGSNAPRHLEHLDTGVASKRNSRVLPLLDVSVDEEGHWADVSPSSSPVKGRQPERQLRGATSFRSLGKPSKTSLRGQAISEEEATAHQAYGSSAKPKPSDPSTMAGTDEWTGNGLTTNDSEMQKGKSRMQEMRDRARQRYASSRIAQNSAQASRNVSHTTTFAGENRRRHIRDASRQSRLSHMSGAGTFTSIGTRFTEGSFGATGGFRAKLVNTFKPKKNSMKRTPTTQSVRAEHRRRGKRTSSRGGVVPGAVGTSAGGTNWIGQSFEIGRRFWEATSNREELLVGSVILEEDEEVNHDASVFGKSQNAYSDMLRKHSTDTSVIKRSPSDVLNVFAKEASNVKDDKGIVSTSQAKTNASITPALVFSGSDSEPSDEAPVTPARSPHINENDAPVKRSASTADMALQAGHALERAQSHASLVSVPQDREAPSAFDIENRSGWSDVVSFISAQSNLPSSIQRSARSATEGMNGLGNRAKRALDEQVMEFRSRQNALKEAREKNRTGVGKLTIPEASQASEEASRAATPEKVTMTQKEALRAPDIPLAAVDRFPEATFELTRRPSLPGIVPGELQNDAASDHEVAARPTFEKDGHTPVELPSQPAEAEDGDALPSILQHESGDTSMTNRKMVSFRASTIGNRLAPPQRSMTTGQQFLNMEEQDKGLSLLAGRIRPAMRSGDAAPAPPEEVLSRDITPDERSPNEIDRHNLGQEVITSRSVLKRDRMLIKIAWTPSEDVPKEFTERVSRKYEIHSDPFREYMAVYRQGRLELWDDPSWTSRMIGHSDQLKLRYIAPLRRGRAFVSLFSPVDTIFCLSFIADHSRGIFDLRKSGTHIWLFDARAQSNAADWMWELWRELGGEIPDAVDVHVPVLSFRVRIPIPDEVPVFDARSQISDERLSAGDRAVARRKKRQGGAEEYGEGYKVITRDNVVKVVTELTKIFPQWHELCTKLEKQGMKYGLAWRTHTGLNWVQHGMSVEGSKRDWAVLVGSLLSDSKAPSSLEFRLQTHYPQTVQTARGSLLHEPPAIEGFLWRVKAVSGALTRLYVSSQDGLLFISRPSRAYPPERIVATESHLTQLRRSSHSSAEISLDRKDTRHRRAGSGSNRAKQFAQRLDSLQELGRTVLDTITNTPATLEELDEQIEAYHAYEKRRLFEQVHGADGYVDVRDIFVIRTLDEGGPVRRTSTEGDQDVAAAKAKLHTPTKENEDVQGSDEIEDVGGEEGYEMSSDRAALKQCRQFEVTVANGRTIRFEAYSKSVAREWVNYLGDLSRYWKRREKVDALELMNASGYDPKLIQHRLQVRAEPRPLEQAADSERLAPLLGNIWNLCPLEACRTIVRSGRLFTKKKPYAAFTSRYCVLLSGRLLTYRLITSNRTARLRQNSGIFHKRQDTVIHLRDSYVYSGKLSDHMLVNGRSDGAGAIGNFGAGSGGASTSTGRHTLPRVYADGMLSVDEDEECTFVIRYRPQRVNTTARPHFRSGITGAVTTVGDAQSATTAASTSLKGVSVTTLRDSTVDVIAMRARSRLERDLWVWCINAERERIVREDKLREQMIRQTGQTPYRSHH